MRAVDQKPEYHLEWPKPQTSGLTQKSKLERYYTFQIVAMDSDEWT